MARATTSIPGYVMLIGGNDDYVVYGSCSADSVTAGSGADLNYGYAGADTFIGSAGDDAISFSR